MYKLLDFTQTLTVPLPFTLKGSAMTSPCDSHTLVGQTLTPRSQANNSRFLVAPWPWASLLPSTDMCRYCMVFRVRDPLSTLSNTLTKATTNTHTHRQRQKRANAYSGNRWPCPHNPLWCCGGQLLLNVSGATALQTWATFPLTDPNCQGAGSCQSWLSVSLLGRLKGTGFSLSLCPSFSLSLLLLFVLCQSLNSTILVWIWPRHCNLKLLGAFIILLSDCKR